MSDEVRAAAASRLPPPASRIPHPASRPSPAAPREYHFPTFERQTLRNGLSLIVAPVRKLPVVTVTMVGPCGASSESEGQDGVANLTARALLEGSTRSSGEELTERIE